MHKKLSRYPPALFIFCCITIHSHLIFCLLFGFLFLSRVIMIVTCAMTLEHCCVVIPAHQLFIWNACSLQWKYVKILSSFSLSPFLSVCMYLWILMLEVFIHFLQIAPSGVWQCQKCWPRDDSCASASKSPKRRVFFSRVKHSSSSSILSLGKKQKETSYVPDDPKSRSSAVNQVFSFFFEFLACHIKHFCVWLTFSMHYTSINVEYTWSLLYKS